ncbi:MAG: polysaccharide biosynthesis/export family protein [Leptolyngbyaceae cyanobacterium]
MFDRSRFHIVLALYQRLSFKVLLTAACCVACPTVVLSQPLVAPLTTESAQTSSVKVGQANGSGTSAAVIDTSYLLGPGDQISLSVVGYDDFTNLPPTGPAGTPTRLVQDILPDGTISIPLVGSVRAAGQTLNSLTQEITTKLKIYLVSPVVSLSLVNLRPVRVIVSGQVERPGPIQLANLSNTRDRAETTTAPTLTSAIATAGGVSREADLRRVTLKRILPGGKTETVNFNLWEMIALETGPQDPVILRDGDAIFVPKLEVGNPVDSRLISRSSLAPATVRVRVVGEVKTPGIIAVRPDSSISSAIAAAGGPTVDAKLSNTEFVRMNENGKIEVKKINLHGLSDNIQIQEGDVIFVPRTTFASVLDYLGRLAAPIGTVGVFRAIFP